MLENPGAVQRTLEHEFCPHSARHALDQLRARRSPPLSRAELAEACGLADADFLDRLTSLGARPETVAALVLAPLVIVAWADGRISAAERGAILEAAERFRVERGTPTFNLLGRWLTHPPPRSLRRAWMRYVALLCRSLDRELRERIARRILRAARHVAHADRRCCGIGPAMRRSERRALAELELAFTRDDLLLEDLAEAAVAG